MEIDSLLEPASSGHSKNCSSRIGSILFSLSGCRLKETFVHIYLKDMTVVSIVLSWNTISRMADGMKRDRKYVQECQLVCTDWHEIYYKVEVPHWELALYSQLSASTGTHFVFLKLLRHIWDVVSSSSDSIQTNRRGLFSKEVALIWIFWKNVSGV